MGGYHFCYNRVGKDIFKPTDNTAFTCSKLTKETLEQGVKYQS